MLPTPQRKGGCRPCRERNVECDKKKPRCSECITADKICGGYDLGNIFINMNSSGPPPIWNRSQNAQKYLVLDWDSQPGQSQFATTGDTPATTTPSNWALSVNIVLPNSDPNDLPGIVELFLDLYYRRFSPDGLSAEPLQPGSECGGWRALLPHWIGKSPILDTAIRALAASFVGSQYQDQSLVDQGRNMYLNALHMVQQVLLEPESAQRTDLLATTLVMSSTEVFMSNGGGASQITHIDGATRLLHSVFDNQTFEDFHVYVLNQGLFDRISTRRRYTFSSPSYRPRIRHLYSMTASYRNHLYFEWCETILPLPNILSAADNAIATIGNSTPSPPAAVSAILDDLHALEHAVQVWYDTLKSGVHGPWTFPTAQVGTDRVPFPLQFISIEVCTLYCLYWTSQLLILDARNALIAQPPLNRTPDQSSLELPVKISEYASLICRSVQFCTQNHSFASSENIFLPLHAVASYYTRQGDEDRTKWCLGAFAKIAEEQKIGYSPERLDLVNRVLGPGPIGLSDVWDDV
ncbi:hypothetical protein K491DRAFT_289968 [Lophiostoma macrostomum CBS 122681]|uniref:Zn(2)-C6 fungal-type domain-containing protein n=1 Tax=Lophiostoma macrostomum CBS 122681 TaxID=1314788 RepID=A0A6A6TGY9_9PLEO|nr:hypothetical protein K491DRAFT_289968 [Lophiostoma macrostomum CBS 122681]